MASTEGELPKVYIPAKQAQEYAESLLVENQVPADNAATIARCLVEADLRGVDTHGLNRLPSYMERLRQGVMNAKATPSLDIKTPVVALVDGNNGFGFLAATAGMDFAISAAKTYGIGMASVKRSNHFGLGACYALQAAREGMTSLIFTNSSPAMAPWGSKKKIVGVSPLACGAPGGVEKPFILDMAPSTAARGKLYKAVRRSENVPLDWALDANGFPTDGPAAALKGVMLPMGGPKGSALAIMMDVFSGVLSGSEFAGGVTGPYDPSKASDVGHLMIAIKPDVFLSIDEFKGRMDLLFQKITQSEKAPGVGRVYFPGEIEQLNQESRLKTGIPYVEEEIKALNEEARRAGSKVLLAGSVSLHR
ncbi:Ldh family oxidoreductase [Aspergillus brunneoviolaceus CBS 621.78]|uniref:Malate/L-lactate dehydrogenase n=1 Tax=Aspergillus brunneoviolaceus CBS 621.78 TaxID=1450534 RepID=A0ACD1GAB0_9EURO|nr:Malate/L-lactate dehydrogenase [Aspergillus brunneoviolaceus CBS 621.78]RAH46194.1 Malate/L-lactate dehydrogenase [Aspergillus brunneoviolaceus CBS 621.78]